MSRPLKNVKGVLGYSKADVKDLLDGVKELTKANGPYQMAEQYYKGTRPEFFANIRYKMALARTGTTYRMNFSKTPVNAVVDRLTINSISAADSATTVELRKVLDANQFDLEAPEIHRRACEFGDAYLLIWPNDDLNDTEDDEADDAARASKQGAEEESSEQTNSSIDLYYNDPRNMRIFYDEENPRQKKYAIKRWQSGAVFRANLIYPDRIEKWVTKQGARGDRSEDWDHYDDGTGTWPIDNPYGMPVFHFRTERPYGTPEHIDAYGPQDAITKIVITHMNTMDYHGFPQRYALVGGDLDDGDADMEDFGFDDAENDSNEDATGAANRATVKSEPGSVWILRNIKSVGQFDAAQSNVFMEPFDVYVRSMAQLTTTPLHYFDPAGGTPSGESLRVADAPMVKKVNNRQMSFGATWRDACEFILLLLGHPDPTGTVTMAWEAAAAQNDLLTWDLAMYKRAMGVPIRQCLLEVGYTPDQLNEWGVPESKWEAPQPVTAANPTKGLPPLARANSSTL